MADSQSTRSVPDLLGDLTRETTTLVRKEVELVRTELRENLRAMGRGGMEIAGGAILLLGALIVLLEALVIALANWIGAGWAALVVGVVVALIGFAMVRMGTKAMQPDQLIPDRSIHQAREDAHMAKEKVR